MSHDGARRLRMVKRILLPLDGSARAENAIPLTVRLASLYGAEVIVLRVVEHRNDPRAAWVDPVAWRLERGEALLYLNAVRNRFSDAGLAVDLDVTMGDPAEEIIESARIREADLVVVTNPAPEDGDQAWLTGTAHRVVVGVGASVLVIPPQAVPDSSEEMGTILVPLDGSRRSEWALRLGLNLATAAGASATCLYVVPEPEVIEGAASEVLRSHAEAYVTSGRQVALGYLRALIDKLETPGVETCVRVESGTNVPREITRVADEVKASLILASAHGHTGATGCRFGAVTMGLLQRVNRPLLILQDAAKVSGTGARGRGARAATVRAAKSPR
jgi:nucleotide-binding universal stress UspA family protein